LPDSQPFNPDRLKSLTGETLSGNEIVLDIGNDLFAFYGHLQPGSIVVQERDQVCRGQILAQLGNSGNSDAPHLHFQINRVIPRRGEAVPYVFEEYEHLGVWDGNWAFNTAAVFEEMWDGTIESMTQSWVREEEAGPAQAMLDSMTVSILHSTMPKVSVAVGPAPKWLRALNKGRERRRLEMPGSNAVIRFAGNPRGR
jgi:murein DD-endopeptidase MepM/ murein hydrolase activator NlpD